MSKAGKKKSVSPKTKEKKQVAQAPEKAVEKEMPIQAQGTAAEKETETPAQALETGKKTGAQPDASKTSPKNTQERDQIFQERMSRHHDELRWLYMELYQNDSMFAELCENMHQFYLSRSQELKMRDTSRETDKGWYKQNDMLGMMLYIDNFAGDMKGVESKLDYMEQCNVNYVHLMPFLETTEGRLSLIHI